MRKAALTLGALALTLALVSGATGTLPFGDHPPPPPPKPHEDPKAKPKPKKKAAPHEDTIRGPRGLRGPAGPRGARGPAGAPGADGLPGAQGLKGDTGAAGATGATGAAGAPGPQGAQGPQGVQGPQGLPGPAGASALTAVPSGQTIYGAVGGDFNAGEGDAVSDWGAIVSMPMRAANTLGDDDVFIDTDKWTSGDDGQVKPETTDTNEGCVWDDVNNRPDPPPGVVCIFVMGGDNATEVNGYSVLPGAGESPFGFKLAWTAPKSGDTFIDALWAYQAP